MNFTYVFQYFIHLSHILSYGCEFLGTGFTHGAVQSVQGSLRISYG